MIMRRLLVVSYPIISDRHFDWIQAVRSKYDKLNFQTIDPHFTLVFPIANLGSHSERLRQREILVNHVKRSIENIQSFEFVIRCATIYDDAFSKYTHVFLVPDEGYSQIIKLHDRLYTGVLAQELRLDLPFIPHIGIANSLDARDCKQLADRLNQQELEIAGKVDKLDLIWEEDDRVGTIEEVWLTRSRSDSFS
jgi:2'-5' RNA ligase